MENELRECPFCGEPATPGFGAQDNFVRCTGCRCRTWSCYDTAAKAIAAWNTRASDNRKCGDCVHWRQELDDPDRKVGMCIKTDTPREAGFDCADFTKRGEK